jgi:hypothetical protein
VNAPQSLDDYQLRLLLAIADAEASGFTGFATALKELLRENLQ